MDEPAARAFLNPPYNKDLIEPVLAVFCDNGWLADGAVVVVEAEAKLAIEAPECFSLIDTRKYGAARVTFL
jgi:16S rRNA (guanine966-N2)-methyltransferase